MNRLIITIALITTILSSFSQKNLIQTISGAMSPTTKAILYTCPPGEEFYYYELYSNLKVNGNKFACVTLNKSTSELSFILNGDNVVTAKNLELYWIDLTSHKKCIFSFSDKNGDSYLYIEGKLHGPYELINYWQYACKYNWDGTPNTKLLYNRNAFEFKRMGTYYRHDNDGSIYRLQYRDGYRIEENPIYKSPNGNHIVQFTDNFHNVNVDGTPMPLLFVRDNKLEDIIIEDCFVTNDGIAVGNITGLSNSNFVHTGFIIKDSTISIFDDTQYFDPYSKTIKKKTPNLPKEPKRQMESNLAWDGNNWVNGIDISVSDPTNRHILTANWNYDYVMIDNKKFGKQAPITAFYDKSANAFGWVTMEGRQLILYTYKLQ